MSNFLKRSSAVLVSSTALIAGFAAPAQAIEPCVGTIGDVEVVDGRVQVSAEATCELDYWDLEFGLEFWNGTEWQFGTGWLESWEGPGTLSGSIGLPCDESSPTLWRSYYWNTGDSRTGEPVVIEC